MVVEGSVRARDGVALAFRDHALELSRPVVCGHSWGGMVTVHYAARHPESRAAVNLDGWGIGGPDLCDGMDPDEAAREIEAAAAAADPLARFPREGDAAWAESARTLLGAIWKANGVASEEVGRWADRSLAQRADGTWSIRPDPVAYEVMRHDARILDLLAEVSCPILIVQATDVSETELARARHRGVSRRLRELGTERSNLTVAAVDHSDHNGLITTHAATVAALVRSFAADLP